MQTYLMKICLNAQRSDGRYLHNMEILLIYNPFGLHIQTNKHTHRQKAPPMAHTAGENIYMLDCNYSIPLISFFLLK